MGQLHGRVNLAGGTWDCKEEWGVLDRDTVVWTVWKVSFCGHEVVALGCAGEMELGLCFGLVRRAVNRHWVGGQIWAETK